jgi:hypothetical protein
MLALVLCAPEGARAEAFSLVTRHADHDVRPTSPCAGVEGHAVALPAARPEVPAVVGTDTPGRATVLLPVSGEAAMLPAAAPRLRPHDILVPRAPPRA